MKNDAQAILLFTGHPLEPIVAFQVQKSIQSQLSQAKRSAAASTFKGRKSQAQQVTNKHLNN
jgi:hypothetical protein